MSQGVSVILTVRGDDTYLDGAIKTVCTQTCRPVQLVLIDDGINWKRTSAESIHRQCNSAGIELTLEDADLPGRAQALNTGLDNCLHQLVAILDVDDRWHPCKLSSQIDTLERLPTEQSTIILGTATVNRVVNAPVDFPPTPSSRNDQQDDINDVSNEVFLHCPLTHSSIIMTRSFLESIGGYSTDRSNQVDWEMFARAIMHGGKLLCLGSALTMKSLHPAQSFEARSKFSYLWSSIQLQWEIQRKMRAPWWLVFAIVRRSLIWLLPRYFKWRLQALRQRTDKTTR